MSGSKVTLGGALVVDLCFKEFRQFSWKKLVEVSNGKGQFYHCCFEQNLCGSKNSDWMPLKVAALRCCASDTGQLNECPEWLD